MSARPAQPARRQLTYAVLLCLAGAGLALYAATRTWSVEITVRATPLPPKTATHTGGDLLPWLPALALVGLAAAGALLATRGTGRRLVGGLMVLVGLGVAAGGANGLAGLEGDQTKVVWAVLCGLGGLLVVAAGLVTAARGHTWPAMGARYDRPRPGTPGPGHAPAGTAVEGGRVEAGRTVAAWEALDRGEDPTVN
ncbi:putative membrane protein (TIGR02234 family) [Micromonospora pisi]|uniref:Putative membrane protein (TIGR02234 family) n=1 Tax=Micromonospora pisi TaxID=589240 RepID=A0A495JGH2_9ACTN|nr:Trp biosynthesis-associated membrane protein [Micromonospora pisi]RKR87139.1 putative membrane protein (TIGR02234 family) [Micromonospora pisi]